LTKSPTSSAGNAYVTSQENAASRVRVDQRVSAVGTVEVPVFVCLRSSFSHVIEVERS